MTTDSTADRSIAADAQPFIPRRVMARLRSRRRLRSKLHAGRLTAEEFHVLETLFERGAASSNGAHAADRKMERADVLVFICTSPRDAERAEARYRELHQRNADVIVVVPCGIDPFRSATQHYAITPGSERVLLYGMANILIASGWLRDGAGGAHTSDFDEFASLITYFTTDRVSSATGLCADDLWHFAQTIADGKRVSFQWLSARARRAIAADEQA